MIRISAAVVTLLMFCCSAVAEQLTLERIYDSPNLNGQLPYHLSISPDGKRVTYLQGKETDFRRYDLWEYNIKDKQHRLLVDSAELFKDGEVLSDEEKARRERMRIRGSGIVSYTWSDDGKALLFPANGDIYYYDIEHNKSRRLTQTPGFETDVRFSPKGHFVSYIRDQNLYVLNLANGKETAITKDGGGLIKYGMAEFVAQEEMDRMTGYWWAPDESRIAFTRTDESKVEEIIRNEIYADEIKLFKQRYPYAGSTNAEVALAVYSLPDGKTDWVDLGQDKDIYLPRVKWAEDSRTLSYQWQDRDFKLLKLRFYDSVAKTQRTALKETSSTWLNLNNDLYFLKDKKHFIWASERDGFKHLYLYRMDGTLVRQLTHGDWVVDSLKGVDEANKLVYFSGRADTPLESHLYVTGLFEGKGHKRITQANSYHSTVVSDNQQAFVDYSSAADRPYSVALRAIDGKLLTWMEKNEINRDHPLYRYKDDLVTPTFGTLKASDGQTLYYKIYKPKHLKSGKRYPAIVSVYGGPNAQKVVNRWDSGFYLQYLVQQGYVVFQLDNRGSNYRGKKFEDAIYRRLGKVEVEDQIVGVKYLRSLDFVDSKHIGVYGHSYGGYMALMSMFTASDYFQAGVAGAPVTDWRLYDTYYTERFLDHPKDNAAGYEASSVFPYAENLKGPLLIYHGMADDNVLFKNSTKLFKVLQDLGKPFEMMTYPGSKHSMRGKKVGIHLHMTITDFFNRHLKG